MSKSGSGEADRRMDVLLKLYEVNYDYQNQKEQRLWLFFSIYITILLAAIGWILANPDTVKSFWGTLAFGGVVLLFSISGIVYMLHQNWLKAWSVERDYRLEAMIKRFDAPSKPSYKAIVLAAYPAKADPARRSKCRIFFSNGWSGVILVFVMLLIALGIVSVLIVYVLAAQKGLPVILWR